MRAPFLLSAFLLTAASTAACSSEAVAPPPRPPVGSLEPNRVPEAGPDVVTAKERALPELYARALGSSSSDAGAAFGALLPLLDPDLAGFASPGARPAHEPLGIAAAHADLFGSFDDRQVHLTRVWRTPTSQTLEWVLTGTQARDWQGVAATRRPVAFRGLTLLSTNDDGRITDLHVYFDVAAVKAQLGAPGPKELVGQAPETVPTAPAQVYETDGAPGAIARVKQWLDELEGGHEASYADAVTDDVQVDTLERPAAVRGKEGVRAYFRAMHKAIGQLDTSVLGEWSVGAFAIVEYSINGEQLSPIGWVPAQRDKVVRWEVVDVCELRDGKIAHVWRFDSPSEIAAP